MKNVPEDTSGTQQLDGGCSLLISLGWLQSVSFILHISVRQLHKGCTKKYVPAQNLKVKGHF